MDTEAIRADILAWIDAKVKRPHPAFNGMPVCPYTAQASSQSRIGIQVVEKPIKEVLLEVLSSWDDTRCVTVVADTARHDLESSVALVKDLNSVWMPKDMVVLLDHPDDRFEVNGFHTGNGKHVLYLVQRLSLLNKAALDLKAKTRYYETWSQESKDAMVTWRFGGICPI